VTAHPDERARWIEAAKQLAADPAAAVRCPRCDQADLIVHDVPFERDPSQLERVLRCPACGAMSALRMRRP